MRLATNEHIKKANGYFVYILTNRIRRWWYIGVTANIMPYIERDIFNASKSGYYHKKYLATYLIHYEFFNSIAGATERHSELNTLNRKQKTELIRSYNPELKFLYEYHLRKHYTDRQL